MSVEDRVATLEQTIAALRVQLDAVVKHRASSMQKTLQCPGCGHDRIVHVRSVKESGGRGAVDLTLGAEHSTWSGIKPGDPFEVFVCRACGLVEWHATGFGKLVADGKNVIELQREREAPPGDDPYR